MDKRRILHDRDGKIALWQWPNAWLIIWAVAAALRLLALPHTLNIAVRAIGTASLIVWAILEIFQGVSYFRRGLGLVVLALSILSILGIHL